MNIPLTKTYTLRLYARRFDESRWSVSLNPGYIFAGYIFTIRAGHREFKASLTGAPNSRERFLELFRRPTRRWSKWSKK